MILSFTLFNSFFSPILPLLQSDEKFSAFQTSELQDEVYCAFIEKFKNDQSELEKLFEHFRQFCVFARPPVQNLLLKHFIRGSAVTDRRGLCYNCKERIPSFTFRHELQPILRTHTAQLNLLQQILCTHVCVKSAFPTCLKTSLNTLW